jgi:polyisoprenoid-binding protein YceI
MRPAFAFPPAPLGVASLVLLAATALAQPAATPPPAEPFPARLDLVGAEIFSIDRAHSYLGFSIGFLDLSKVRGTFGDYEATILYDDERPETSSVTLVIDAASIATQSEFRDRDLEGPSFFDVEKHPRLRFQSTRFESLGGERYRVHGDLTIKGVTKPIAIDMTRTARRAPDAAWGNIRLAATGAVTIKRRDFGLLGNEFWGQAIADEVAIELDIVGLRFNYDRWGFNSKDKPSIGEVLWQGLEAGGTATAAAARFRELQATQPDAYTFGAGQLGIVVNRLMQRRRAAEALELLAVGREAYPDEPGFWARSGEAHAALGHRDEAIRMYEKAQELKPDGTESAEMLRRLRALPKG